MMKRTLSLLLAVLLLLLFTMPVSARSISDLQTVCDNLTQYLYTPYYTDSEFFAAYQEAFSNAKKLVSENNATPAEIEAHYQALKQAFTQLSRDCFDYSLLDQIAADYESLSISLYEEETWRSLSDIMDAIYDEIDAPTVFKKGNSTKESYAKEIQNFVQGHYTDFVNAYNQLQLKPLPENIQKDELLSLLNYCNLSAHEAFMSQSPYWSQYQSISNRVKAFQTETDPDQDEMNQVAAELLEVYKTLSASCFDLSPIQNELDLYRKLTSNTYTTNSWSKYREQIEKLEALAEEPQFLYLKNYSGTEEDKAAILSFFAAKAKPAAQAYAALVTQESVNKLSALCNTYHNATASHGVEVKLKLLLESVENGYLVLADNSATASDVENAIADIENAAENLSLAEGYLSDAQSGNVTSDVGTIQYILIFTLLTLILSLICACVFSYRRFGRLNWHQ